MADSNHQYLADLLRKRILILDGAMGTMLMRSSVSSAETLEFLNLSQPHLVRSTHDAYLEAGADIISTNSLNANILMSRTQSTGERMLEKVNLVAASLARNAVEIHLQNTGRQCFVAGVMGPTDRSCSEGPAVGASSIKVNPHELMTAYAQQVEALVEGGVDILLIETVTHLANLQAALDAIEALRLRGKPVPPVWISVVVTADGDLISGETVERFVEVVKPAQPMAVGFNCFDWTDNLGAPLRQLAELMPDTALAVYPNAGCPDIEGKYRMRPSDLASIGKKLATEQLVNILGGCCGTTPQHIDLLAKTVRGFSPRPITPPEKSD